MKHRVETRVIQAWALCLPLLSGCSLWLGWEPGEGAAAELPPDTSAAGTDPDPPGAAATEEAVTLDGPVAWQNAAGVSAATAGELAKIAPSGWGNAGASSKVRLTGDGRLRTTVSETSTLRILGLSDADINLVGTTIGWGFYLNNSTLYVYETGTTRLSSTYSSGDVLEIARSGSTITYAQNGALLYTSGIPAAGPLLVDAALYTSGATWSKVELSGALEVPAGTPVTWTNVVGVTPHGNSLVKTADTGWGNAGAAGALPLSGDGHLQFQLRRGSEVYMIGLSTADTDQSSASIGWAFHVSGSDKNLAVVEQGVSRGVFGTAATADILSIERSGSTLTYRRNGVALYTSSVAAIGPLVVDTAIYGLGHTVAQVTLVGPTATAAPPAQPPAADSRTKGAL